ncbi:MAG: lipoyl(octanoyl) transferase LipB [Opitutaceae bacterium]|nr:lipoyl(octanoyl) transferase LipB [Opitutaceae bacterium]
MSALPPDAAGRAATPVAVLDWGRTAYRDACARQAALVEQRLAGEIGDTLVFTEHEPVFTLGLRPGAETHLVWNAEQLAREGVAVEKTNRGGDITYHGPGQIVGYPIVSLDAHRDLHAYLRLLEEVVINALASLGLTAAQRDGLTGIWVQQRKIAAIGVAVRRWVTYHGFALNVDPDLAHFGGIVPCGIASADGTVTSLRAELGRAVPAVEVRRALEEAFRAQWTEFSRAESPRDLRADPR